MVDETVALMEAPFSAGVTGTALVIRRPRWLSDEVPGDPEVVDPALEDAADPRRGAEGVA
jgi:hypothetical protein